MLCLVDASEAIGSPTVALRAEASEVRRLIPFAAVTPANDVIYFCGVDLAARPLEHAPAAISLEDLES